MTYNDDKARPHDDSTDEKGAFESVPAARERLGLPAEPVPAKWKDDE